jgi:hypothetical protein
MLGEFFILSCFCSFSNSFTADDKCLKGYWKGYSLSVIRPFFADSKHQIEFVFFYSRSVLLSLHLFYVSFSSLSFAFVLTA